MMTEAPGRLTATALPSPLRTMKEAELDGQRRKKD